VQSAISPDIVDEQVPDMTEANQEGESSRHPGVGSVNQSSDTASHSPPPTPITLAVYRDLRLGMVVILVLLAASIVIEKISATCWQSELSAYFYTSAHSIFIAALLALGTLFMVYKGSSDTEDELLTLAGVSALIAAMVPMGRPVPLCGRADLPPEYKIEPVILPNVWAVVIALGLGWLLALWQNRRTRTQRTRSPGGTLSRYFFWLVMAFGLIALAFFPGSFKANAHGAAGTLMLLAFIATAFCTAYLVGSELPHRRFYQRFYRGIAVAMLGTLIVVVAVHLLHPSWERWIIVLEAALILEFAAYWVVQTIDLWNTPDRRERLSEDARNRLAEARTKGGVAELKSEVVKAMEDPHQGEKLLPLL
jgi:hypothetical protein